MRILIIEDQADLRRLFRWALEDGPYEFHEARNGIEGLALAMRLRPAAVLLDVMMPGEMDGLEVCRRLKADVALGPPIVVLLSARAQHSDRQAGLAAGADEYIAKPFSPTELAATVARLLTNVVAVAELTERQD